MKGIGDYISREAVVNEIWKALYSYEDEMEAKFMADPELDVSQWFFHRIFVQTMSSIDLQVILDIPAADVRPVRSGKWIDMGDFISCSSCNATRLKEFNSYYGKAKRLDARANFCPNCGADMREES